MRRGPRRAVGAARCGPARGATATTGGVAGGVAGGAAGGAAGAPRGASRGAPPPSRPAALAQAHHLCPGWRGGRRGGGGRLATAGLHGGRCAGGRYTAGTP